MPLTADDRLAIMETLARYNQAIDGFLPDAADVWADCFTNNGTFRAVTRSGATARDRMPEGMLRAAKPSDSELTDPNALISLQGREQLRTFAAAALATHADRQQPGYHWISNVLIEGDGEQATMTCYLRVMAGKTASLAEAATSTGFYRDQLIKADGEWKFESRSAVFDD
jgi:hypothetical protein